jgi:hypothetical protein
MKTPAIKKNQEESKVIVFHNQSQKKKKDVKILISNKNDNEDQKKMDTSSNLSLKQAKFDVFKFGIKGFDKEAKKNANIDLAIKLGARVRLKISILFLYF